MIVRGFKIQLKNFFQKSCKKIWWIKKVAISLHPLSERNSDDDKAKGVPRDLKVD